MGKNKTELTSKQRRYIKERLKHPERSKSECAKAAGYSDATAKNATVKVENGCREKLLAEMKRAGLTDKYLIGKLKEGLNAKETKLFAHEGKVRDKRDMIDFPTRRAYLDIAHRLRGDFVEKIEHSGNLPNVMVVMPDNGRGKEEPEPGTDQLKPDGA